MLQTLGMIMDKLYVMMNGGNEISHWSGEEAALLMLSSRKGLGAPA